jgi:long-chain acyl-CoA synthetase
MPGIRHVIVFDRAGLATFSDPQVMFLDDFMAEGEAEAKAHPTRFEDALEAVEAHRPAHDHLHLRHHRGRPRARSCTTAT